ncbi:MAG: radical SAM family heme chaperone HemW [Clostridiales bacterium]|nr:radical SAM family heme chaperone HemW [Clostridiales bacterium]
MSNKLGIYLHLPFCRQRCGYCDFYSTCGKTVFDMRRYVHALERHIVLLTDYTPMEADTVYFGGGTPSVIGTVALESLIKTVKNRFSVTEDAEITIEANPGEIYRDFMQKSVNPAKTLGLLRGAGFNRISFGVQSSDSAQLYMLGRRHTFEDAKNAVSAARDAGFENISLDLMYALPGHTMETWKKSISDVISLEPEHISCYALRLEEGTPLYRLRNEQPEDDFQLLQYLYMCEVLRSAGYEQYEVSNFARPGRHSRHNSKYWAHCDYFGFGAGAHSFIGGKRFYYAPDMESYEKKILTDDLTPDEIEIIGEDELFEEFVMLSLRTTKGLNEEEMIRRFSRGLSGAHEFIERCVQERLVTFENGVLKLTPEGFFVSNAVIVEILCLI